MGGEIKYLAKSITESSCKADWYATNGDINFNAGKAVNLQSTDKVQYQLYEAKGEGDVIKVPLKLVGKSRRDPGKDNDGLPAEDTLFNDKPAQSVSIQSDPMFSKPTAELNLYMIQLMESLAMGEMETVVLSMQKHFAAGTGGIYKNTTLDRHVESNPAFKTYHESFKSKLQSSLKAVDYNLNNQHTVLMNLLNFSSLMDKITGLGIAVHQVWSVKAEIKNYTYYKSKRYWTGDLHYTFYDTYGLDWEDILKHGNDRIPQYQTGNCFKAWYILQHYRNAKPFITEMNVTRSISGLT